MAKAKPPASIRNNNPGAMYPGKSSRKFGSTTYEVLKSKDGVHKIATFPTPIQGAAAQFDLLASKSYTGKTLREAITKWCGGFYVSTYLTVLQRETGVHADSVLTRDLLMNPEIAIPICRAMALQEAGRDFPMSDADWRTAHGLAFPGVDRVPDVPATPAGFEPANELPSPKPETRVIKTAKESWTIRGALASVISFIVYVFQTTVEALMQAAAQITEWSPVQSVLTTVGANAGKVAIGLFVAGIVTVVGRRLIDAANGRS